MKQRFLLLAALCLCLSAWAQNDSTARTNGTKESDTLHIGTMTIVRDGAAPTDNDYQYHWHNSHHYKPSNLTTTWLSLDLGFANFNDKTNYASASAQQFAPGGDSYWFSLRNGKSVDVNIWFFTQRLNLVKHVVNLEYGLAMELNNYRYTENIKYLTGPTEVIMDTINYSKNKLAANYFTVPLMLNFNFTPQRKEGFGISVGASVGYLYSDHQKLISSEFGKQKTHNSFDLNPWKISWVAEIQLGPIKLYGSYATQSMFSKGLDQVPYTVGIRILGLQVNN